MKNLLRLIFRYHYVLLFLLLQSFSLLFTFSTNGYQRAGFINSTNIFSGRIYSGFSSIREYFGLRSANRYLAEENAYLRSRYIAYLVQRDTSELSVPALTDDYDFICSKVINNSTHKQKNFITLDKGTNHGIKKNMGVVSSNGIVGIVTDASPNFSSVVSLLHVDVGISTKVKKTGHVGTMRWEGTNHRIGVLRDISTYVQVNIGDSIVTSGYSSVFPEGMYVGRIADYKVPPGENFFTIYVEYSTDYTNLSYAYVVNYLRGAEREELEEKQQDE
jgi:rod shape-determining protein MreC